MVAVPPCWKINPAVSGKKESNDGKCYQDLIGEDPFLGWIKTCVTSLNHICNSTVCDSNASGGCYTVSTN